MIKKLYISFFAILISSTAFSQEIYEGNVQINSGIVLLSSPSGTPLTNIENRIHGDLDVNIFLEDRFAIGGGFDYVTSGLSRAAFSVGTRYYWVDAAFFRAKVHVPIDFSSFDVSAGLGYNYMLGDNIGLESNLDYYIKSESAAFRFGIALFL